MSWFTELTGLVRETPQLVRQQLSLDQQHLVCPNGRRLVCGRLEIPTLAELRSQRAALTQDLPARTVSKPGVQTLRIREQVADVRQLHADAANAGALFQVASQFNLLEMSSPSVTPERGVGIYEADHTQGPACAISCGAGTIYRNYFAPVGQHIGQSAEHQLDCAVELGKLLGNRQQSLWRMQNGYLLPSDQGLQRIQRQLQTLDAAERDRLRASLRIGLQWNAAVTLPAATHSVSQAYCSALPVAYGRQPWQDWTEFAKLVLEAAYEATFCAAVINASQQGSNRLFLTLLGGGVFGNHDDWILAAIERATRQFWDVDLDVVIVSYGASNPSVAALVERLSA